MNKFTFNPMKQKTLSIRKTYMGYLKSSDSGSIKDSRNEPFQFKKKIIRGKKKKKG